MKIKLTDTLLVQLAIWFSETMRFARWNNWRLKCQQIKWKAFNTSFKLPKIPVISNHFLIMKMLYILALSLCDIYLTLICTFCIFRKKSFAATKQIPVYVLLQVQENNYSVYDVQMISRCFDTGYIVRRSL